MYHGTCVVFFVCLFVCLFVYIFLDAIFQHAVASVQVVEHLV